MRLFNVYICRSYFDDDSKVCYTKNVSHFESALQFRDFISANRIQCVLAIHAFKCAGVLKGQSSIEAKMIVSSADCQPQFFAIVCESFGMLFFCWMEEAVY